MSRKFKELVWEIIFLAMFVGAIPELAIGGGVDLFGPCGFSQEVCHSIALQGLIKLVLCLVCILASFAIALAISEEVGG